MAANQKRSFAGKVAFVTGAAGGIGRARALAFAREGASVVVADVSEQGNQETARVIEESGGRALAIRCDVTRTEDVKAAIAEELKTSDLCVAGSEQYADYPDQLLSWEECEPI